MNTPFMTPSEATPRGMQLMLRLRKRGPEAFYSALAALALWWILWAVFYVWPGVPTAGREWIELLNGATWPTTTQTWPNSGFWFAGVLSLRTVLNLAAPLAVVGLLLWIMNGGLERAMNIVEVLSLENAELLERIGALMEKRHPGVLTDDDRKAFTAAAHSLVKQWAKSGDLQHFETEAG